jgi:DNA-dependent metalloprotease WSS1
MSRVKSFTHLKNRPHGDKALAILQRVASLVKPIMSARGWTLPVLSEFFPSNPGLLGTRNPLGVVRASLLSARCRNEYACVTNTRSGLTENADVNHGQKILLRLRPHHSPDSFYEEEEIIGTMLHEASTISTYQRHFWNFLSAHT